MNSIIDQRQKTHRTQVDSLGKGECFELNGRIFMVTGHKNDRTATVCLETGEPLLIEDIVLVQKVCVEISIKANM